LILNLYTKTTTNGNFVYIVNN